LGQSVAFGTVEGAESAEFPLRLATFISLFYNRDNSVFAIFEVDANFRLDASGDQYDAKYVVSETLPNGQVNNLGSGTSHGVRITLKPPVF
jgi:hypothetical protein